MPAHDRRQKTERVPLFFDQTRSSEMGEQSRSANRDTASSHQSDDTSTGHQERIQATGTQPALTQSQLFWLKAKRADELAHRRGGRADLDSEIAGQKSKAKTRERWDAANEADKSRDALAKQHYEETGVDDYTTEFEGESSDEHDSRFSEDQADIGDGRGQASTQESSSSKAKKRGLENSRGRRGR